MDYSATKAAIRAFTRSLAKQLAGDGIRVNAVMPGPFWTPLQVTTGQKTENVVNFGSSTPLGRPGQPAGIAPIYVMLASREETSYVTGQSFGASGGTGVP
ncbi:SDR family oxidoreductase [Palleronia marisminoris]|uniref:SDR family oxidoreductase n=1 Tax=Palleronia marisminoris TaxID=315423 RepID=UPI0023EA6C39|nr:SDR family oxidoreductase [Palleronia marisminoris]